MTSPVKNNQGYPPNDPYGDQAGGEPYNDPYSDPYGGYYGDEYVDDGMGFDDGMGEEDMGGGLSVQDARDYLSYLSGLLADCEDPDKKKDLEADITKLRVQINNAAMMKNPEVQQRALESINNVLCGIEEAFYATDETEEGGETGTGSYEEQVKALREQAAQLLSQGLITQGTFDDIEKKLKEAENVMPLLENDPNGLYAGVIDEALLAATGLLSSNIGADPSAQKIADAMGIPVEDVEAAAEQFGVDLANPQPTEELFLMYAALKGISPDEIKGAIDERFGKMESLKGDLEAQTDAWRQESEDPPSRDKFQKSYDYYNKTDSAWEKIQGLMSDIGNDPKAKAFFEACGFTFSAGPNPDQITLNNQKYDFYNEDKGTFTLSTSETTITQDDDLFAPAPKNTTMGSNNEGTNYKWFHQNAPEGYPDDAVFSSGD